MRLLAAVVVLAIVAVVGAAVFFLCSLTTWGEPRQSRPCKMSPDESAHGPQSITIRKGGTASSISTNRRKFKRLLCNFPSVGAPIVTVHLE